MMLLATCSTPISQSEGHQTQLPDMGHTSFVVKRIHSNLLKFNVRKGTYSLHYKLSSTRKRNDDCIE